MTSPKTSDYFILVLLSLIWASALFNIKIADLEDILVNQPRVLNIIKDEQIGSFLFRQQILKDFPPKELRSVIDQGKKDIKNGIVVSISTFEGKVGIAVGLT